MKSNIKTAKSILPLLGFALLLLLSPCKVRNFIQAELGVPQTDVSNLSVTTASQCLTAESFESVQHVSKNLQEKSTLPALTRSSFSLNSDQKTTLKTLYQTARKLTGAVVPLYILYNNLKVYL